MAHRDTLAVGQNVALMVPVTSTEEESDAWLIHLLTH